MYFLDVNSKHAPTQVEMVLTMPKDALIGEPTMVNAVPIIDTPLITPTELAPVDACSSFLSAFLYFRCFSVYFSLRFAAFVAFPDHLNVETFLTNRWCTRQLKVKIFGHIYIAYKKWIHRNQLILIVMKYQMKMSSGMMM